MKRMTYSMAAALTLVLAACGSGSPAPAPGATSDAAAAAPSASQSGPLTVTDAWAKAQPDISQKKMTGVFGTITNTTTAPVTITSAQSTTTPVTELHETVSKNGQSMMQKVDGGFVIEAGASRELRPGGDHIMLMQMDKPLNPGETVSITLTTMDGQTVTFEAVAKTYTGGDEKYHSESPMPSTSPGSEAPASPTHTGMTPEATPAGTAS